MAGDERDDAGVGSASRSAPASPWAGPQATKTTAGDDALLAVTLPSIAAPRGGGAIRSIGETFRANAVTGTGALSVPLPLSPSRAASGPKLALGYDSGQGQGPFGIGWSVDVPSITRRTDKGLPQYRDADESDEFVLSGAEVLVPALLPDGLDARRARRRQLPRRSATGRASKAPSRASSGAPTGPPARSTGARSPRTTSRASSAGRPRRGSPIRKSRSASSPGSSRRRSTIAATSPGSNTRRRTRPTFRAPSVEEKTRIADAPSFVNLHPKRIHYGNRAARSATTTDPTCADLSALSWLFEVVFDYGEHDARRRRPTRSSPGRAGRIRSRPSARRSTCAPIASAAAC